MHVIKVRNVNEALFQGIDLFRVADTIVRNTRSGRVLELVDPVTTIYERPKERVLSSPVRNANPFFHVMEAFWILAGRSDVKSLVEYNKRMAEFSDDGNIFHAPYGYRLRKRCSIDQLDGVIRELRENPTSRRAVATIWVPMLDLNQDSKDIPCNDLLDFKIDYEGKLNLNIYCRSNDMLWGAYGTNAVQFSYIQQYVAEMLGCYVGVMRQISSNMHVYLDGPGGQLWAKVYAAHEDRKFYYDDYGSAGVHPALLVEEPEFFDVELTYFWHWHETGMMPGPCFNSVFIQTLQPLVLAWQAFKNRRHDNALRIVANIEALDIHKACTEWLIRAIDMRNKA